MKRNDKYTVAELQALPTLSSGQFEDLKVDTGNVRVWLERSSEQYITEEYFNGKAWVEGRKYKDRSRNKSVFSDY